MADFIREAMVALTEFQPPAIAPWLATIDRWRNELPDDIPEEPADSVGYVDAHDFVHKLSAVLSHDEIVFVDTSCWVRGFGKKRMDSMVGLSILVPMRA